MADSGAPDPKSKIPVAIISGPTASGKSSLSIDMARKFEAEIISADSRQIYRQLKIGTDRLDKDQWQGITHHLMGSVDLGQRFTVFDFVKEAGHIIKDANARKKQIIICGGTGLYIRALTEGIFEIPDDDMTYRQDLLDIVAREGPNYIHRMLMEVDPAEAANIHPHNFIKVIRALEIHHITGRTKSDMMAETRPRHENFVFLHIILLPDREKLYERINRRVDDMVDEGLVDETRSVLSSDFGEALRSCKIVGYHELIDHFDGHITLAEAINLIKRNTRRFAKRQFTWFKAVKNAQVINALGLNSISAAEGLISSFLKP